MNPFEKVTKEEIKKETKNYVLLYYAYDEEEDEEIKSFEVLKGRTRMYNFIKGMLGAIDLDRSRLLLDDVPYNGAITALQFMYKLSNEFEETLHLEDYIDGDLDLLLMKGCEDNEA